MHHPHSYLAIQQLEEDRRIDLQQGLRAARARAQARRSRNAAWGRALRSVRRFVTAPAT